MKGKVLECERNEFIPQRDYFEEYVKKTGIELNKIYSIEDTEKILNSNVITIYEGKVLTQKPLDGKTICEVLSDIEERFNLYWSLEFEDKQ